MFSVDEVAYDGQPARLARVGAPRTASVESVRAFYEEVARVEGALDVQGRAPMAALPYVAADQPGGAFVAWTHARTGHRRGVIVKSDAAGIEYYLIDAPPLEKITSPDALVLPGGIRAPNGSRRGIQLAETERGWSFFELASSPERAAAELATAAELAGYSVDQEARRDMDELRAGSRAARSRIVVPFEGKGRRGVFVLSPGVAGGTRATLALR